MHGNTQTSTIPPFHKTRHMSSLVSELSSSLRIHASMSSRLGGVHLELTGDITEDGLSVTECLGGSMQLEEESLGLRFESHCDPRLNFEQSLGTVPSLSLSTKWCRAIKNLSPTDCDHIPLFQRHRILVVPSRGASERSNSKDKVVVDERGQDSRGTRD